MAAPSCSNSIFLICCNDNSVIILPCNPIVNGTSGSTFTNGLTYTDSNNLCWEATNAALTETTSNTVNTYTTYAGDCNSCQTTYPNIPCVDELCYCTSIYISPSDIAIADSNTVYVDVFECGVGNTTLEYLIPGNYSICGRFQTQPYILFV